MTPEQRKTLLDLLHEYDDSLTRIQGEKELQRAMEARAVCECSITAKIFKTVATAYFQDKTNQLREELETLLTVFETVKDA